MTNTGQRSKVLACPTRAETLQEFFGPDFSQGFELLGLPGKIFEMIVRTSIAVAGTTNVLAKDRHKYAAG